MPALTKEQLQVQKVARKRALRRKLNTSNVISEKKVAKQVLTLEKVLSTTTEVTYKYINIGKETYVLYLGVDGFWHDTWGTVWDIHDDRASINGHDDRCGIGILSLPEDHPANEFCKVHDEAYASLVFQAYHTREEADKMLEESLKLGGFWFAKPFYWLARIFGGIFWEGKH